ncbi:MAG: DUF1092 family protein [Leptolyngbyaceae cyanobacterium RU_5_1]|nr:DUF1092 family protein [Leptolyngbyaceae cyanobacterium RU_5_1]
MLIWEADFYRRPLRNQAGDSLWELVICDAGGSFQYSAYCPQSEVRVDWLVEEMQALLAAGHSRPDRVHVFRPQSLSLLETACQTLGILVEPTRHTPTLKRRLEELSRHYPGLPTYTGQSYKPLELDKPPPIPMPENLWGDRWRFATLPASDVVDAFRDRMIPVLEMPEPLLPLNLGLASTVAVPGVVMDGGRRSLPLAHWIEQTRSVALNYVAGAPDGLILEAGLVDRWVVATFEDLDVAEAARAYEQRKQLSQGLHFLLVQPDDSGMTYTGFWLLRSANDEW